VTNHPLLTQKNPSFLKIAVCSPWVCNCDHAWSDHQQEFIEKEFTPLSQLQEQFQVEELNQVHRTDLLQNPITGIL
jgi:hypothetical protein